MTKEDKEIALAKIAELEKGGVWQRRAARRLRKILKNNPGEFWPTYLETINQPSVESAVMMRSGQVTAESTFADMRTILNKDGDGK